MGVKVIRVEKEVPEVYVNQSRDFQLLCRLFDVVFNGVKFNIDRAKYLSNPRLCTECYLQLLADKYGFDYSSEIYKDQLRVILSAFKRMVMYKGSRRGISEAVNCFSYLSKLDFKYEINMRTDGDVSITIYHRAFDTSILDDILKYIIPAGCVINYEFTLASVSYNDDEFIYSDELTYVVTNITNNVETGGKVYKDSTKYEDNQLVDYQSKELVGSFNTTQIAIPKDSDTESKAIFEEGRTSDV